MKRSPLPDARPLPQPTKRRRRHHPLPPIRPPRRRSRPHPPRTLRDGPANTKRSARDLFGEVAQARFAAIRLKIHESTPPARCGGRLAELERKALAYEAVQGQIEYKDAMIETMRSALDETRTTLEAQRKEILALSDKIAAQTADLSASAEEKAYEYYEIKEGDTVESIAAQPSVYGDAARHVLIRQANRGHVKDLDRLVPGEVVIIPRFPASGRYEF